MTHRNRHSSIAWIVLTFCCLLILGSCSLTPSGSAYLSPIPTASPTFAHPITVVPLPTATPPSIADLAARITQNMTLQEKLGQMTIVEFYGSTLNSDLQSMILKYHIGGVLIENKNGNAQNRAQLVTLNQGMQKIAPIPLFISTDFEGGYVNELVQITGQRESEQQIGATGNTQVAYNAGRNAASDLTSLGLNVNFMPIVDVLTNPNNPGLPMRTFGNNPTIVTAMGQAYLKGLTAGGVIGCLKHFPGLGSATVDPHLSLPYMNRSLATLNAVDFVPYRTMINEGMVPMVMVTHIMNPQLDPKLPTSLSPNVVTGLLRNQLHFKGVIISDTLWMGGISNTYPLPQAAVLAVKAGEDLILGPRGLTDTQNMLNGLYQAVTSGQISVNTINASVERILELKMQYKVIPYAEALKLARGDVSAETSTPGTGMIGSPARTADGIGAIDVNKRRV
ncbi:MAG: glycoside hydrolase family 3 N-terminal domain-containing protein [Ktedonobacteraceae bacterium]